ncbi:family 1 glycosylhydrolase, partial [Burkholderia contaminans]|nr:family 1 glycosylhydrolase [Burkholderia contaminans]
MVNITEHVCRKDFTAFADVCFREFGDRVSYWTTLNEPNIHVLFSYDFGLVPPNRCSSPFGFKCTKGNSSSEPYLATHH